MINVNIYIEHNPLFYNKVKWIMNIISQYTQIPYNFVTSSEQSNISIGSTDEFTIKVDRLFYLKLQNKQTKWKHVLPDGPVYKNNDGEECLLETIFYLVNCLQELTPESAELDQYGRFKYVASLQYHYGIIETNFVGELIDQLIKKYPLLSAEKGIPKYKSKVFLSHDIDLLRSGWKVEAYLALKDLNLKALGKVIRDFVMLKPFYNNIDQVIALDNSYGFASGFYWLSQYGKDENGIMNADYRMDDLSEMSKRVSGHGCANGMHKSSFSFSLKEEISKLPFKVEHNRYHFLKFQLHKAWSEIEAAGLKTDASLGFAEHIGFRNSYGMPFVPFDLENDRPFSFVEIPLLVMDVSLFNYMGLKGAQAMKRVRDFIQNNADNCLLSFLWHNNQITEYVHHESAHTYINLLDHLEHQQLKFNLPNDLYDQYA